MNFQKNDYLRVYLTNFLPLITNNLLKKGEKEKSFVKVNKVLKRLKKTALLNDSFLVNRRLFFNKILFFGLQKNKILLKNNLFHNQSFIFNFIKKIRNTQDFLLRVRIFFLLSNLYSMDFLHYVRYNNIILKNIIEKKTNLKKKKIKFLIRKKIINLLFFFFAQKKNLIIQKFNNDLFYENLFLNRVLVLKTIISSLFKKVFLFKTIFFKQIKNRFIFSKTTSKNLFKLNTLLVKLKKKKFLIKIKKNVKTVKKYRFKKYYYLNNKIKLLKKQQENLNKKYFLFKRMKKKMSRFEFKKRKHLFEKLKKAYKKSRIAFFKYKKKINKKKTKELKKYKYSKKNLSHFNNNPNYNNPFGLKLLIFKKPVEKKKKVKRNLFFKYSNFPILFSPIKFVNVILSKYRLYFTFKEKRLWGKNQLIPNILNLKRDVRITVRNFKKSLDDSKFNISNLEISLYESLIYAGAKKGFLLKIKQQAYIFMLKNAIFLQFMLKRKKKTARGKRRKKIDRK